MSKLIFLNGLFVCMTVFSFGQVKPEGVTISWGDHEQETLRSSLKSIVGHDETGVYAIKSEMHLLDGPMRDIPPKVTLEHYDHEMNRTNVLVLEMKDKDKKRKYHSTIKIKDNIYVLSTFIDKKNDKKIIYAQQFDKANFKLSKRLKKVGEMPHKKRIISVSNDHNNFGFLISRDSSKLLFMHIQSEDKKANQKYNFRVMNSDLERLWSKRVSLPYESAMFQTNDVLVDNEGNVHLVGRLFRDKRRLEVKGEINYDFHILSWYSEATDLREYTVKEEDRFLNTMKIAINNDNHIICSGFYNLPDSEVINGSFFLKLNPESKEMIAKSFQAFDFDLFVETMTEKDEKIARKREAKGKSLNIESYSLRDLILKEDGSAILIGEQVYIDTYTPMPTRPTTGVRVSQTRITYRFDNVIVVNISSTGDIQWSKMIAKAQAAVGDGKGYGSYALAIVDEELNFIFNDHLKNMTYQEGDRVRLFTARGNDGFGNIKSIVTLVNIDEEGKMTRNTLTSTEETNVLTKPLFCRQLSNNSMILFGENMRKHQFAKVTFE